MIDLVKSWYQHKVAEQKNATTQLDSEARIMQEASQLVVDRPDRDGWVSLISANDAEKGMNGTDHLEMIRKARQFYKSDPNARAALSTLVNYIMGKGLSITPKSDDPMVWYVWKDFVSSPRNRWTLKQFEIVFRPLRDGEIFIEFFDEDENKKATGKATMRFIDPLLVKPDAAKPTELNQTIQNGVITDPEDVERVIEYNVQKRENQQEFRKVPSEKVHHIKVNVDSDQKRGESALLPVMKMFKHHEQWIENRILLNKMRSAIVLVRKIEGSPGEVAGMANTIPTANTPSGTTQKKSFKAGTILTAGPGVSYDMLSANLNAADAKEDGRNIKTTIAAGLNLPEYVFGDASNQNYASSLIAESPFVKAIQFWQVFFEFHFGQIYRKVIEIAVKGNVLTAPSDDEYLNKLKAVRGLEEAAPPEPPKPGEDTEQPNAEDEEPIVGAEKIKPELSPKEKALAELMPNGRLETPTEIFYGCDMDWPEIVHRDPKLFTEALSLARQNGWIADSTACAALGYDYSEEVRKQRQIEDEAATSDNPLLGLGNDPVNDAGNMDAELEDMLNGLSPEERDQVLKTKDPREVVRIMNKKKSTADAGGDE
jgi:capsid protein